MDIAEKCGSSWQRRLVYPMVTRKQKEEEEGFKGIPPMTFY
jgi:hypothetical protein